MFNLTTKQLKIFVAAAKHLNFTKAAKEVFISTPAISMQIKELENILGIKLFLKANRKIKLTAEGELFLNYAHKNLKNNTELFNTIHERQKFFKKTIKIGIVSTAQYYIPKLLNDFKTNYKSEIQFSLYIKNRESLVTMLVNNEIDLAIMGRAPDEVVGKRIELANHPHAFIAHPDHPLANKKKIKIHELNDYEIISREPGSGTRANMESFFLDHEIYPKITMEITGNEGIKQSVKANLGIAFLSLYTVMDEIKNHTIAKLNINGTPVIRKWFIVNSDINESNKTINELIDYLIIETRNIKI